MPNGALDSVVRQLLASAEPIAIGLGPALEAVHNDAFAATIGAEARQTAGAVTLRDLCAALWARVAAGIERALSAGETMVLEDQLLCRSRNGCSEEAYLRFACGPLMEHDGGIAGVVVTLADTTERVISNRRTAALQAIASSAAPNSTAQQACRRALAAVARHPSDLPFGLLYLSSTERGEPGMLRLAACSALVPGTAASPTLIDLGKPDDTDGWPVGEAMRANRSVIVENLLNRFGALPGGEWPLAPRCAVVVPLVSPGSDERWGALICGVSARHPLNAAYQTFVDLVANQIAAVIAGGRVYEERERSARLRAASRLKRARRRARLHALRAKFDGALEERTRLARELHDTLLQGVTGIALLLRAVLPEVRAAPKSAFISLEQIAELAERTSSEARQAVWNMRRPTRAPRCLLRTLETTARRVIASTSIELRMSVSGRAQRTSAERQSVIARIVQEAIANAVRHAEAHSIWLDLVYEPEGLRIEIGDDGRGFTVEPDLRAYLGHWGLLGMTERAHSLGGTLTVSSALGRGTIVSVFVPGAHPSRRRTKVIG